MAYELKEGQGSLFVNEKKETEKHPDFSGSILVSGKKFFLAGWKKKTKDGRTWLSLQANLPKGQENAAKPVANRDYDPFEDGMA